MSMKALKRLKNAQFAIIRKPISKSGVKTIKRMPAVDLTFHEPLANQSGLDRSKSTIKALTRRCKELHC